MSVASRNGTPERACAGPGCEAPVPPPATGRPGRFCSGICRSRAHRLRQRQSEYLPVVVEVDFGSASSRGRSPERAWMVRMRRGERSVIVAIGLPRHGADRLAQAIADLLGDAGAGG